MRKISEVNLENQDGLVVFKPTEQLCEQDLKTVVFLFFPSYGCHRDTPEHTGLILI